jgi:dTDP-4-amino-4,6-dideoxygalactose transaminase
VYVIIHQVEPSKIQAIISHKTKIIMPVHYAGQPCEVNEILKIAKKIDLSIIEDNAHARLTASPLYNMHELSETKW